MNWPWINKDYKVTFKCNERYLSIYLSIYLQWNKVEPWQYNFIKSLWCSVNSLRRRIWYFFHRIVGKIYESRSMLYKQGSSILSRRLIFDGFLTSLLQAQTFACFSITREAKLACTGKGSTSVRTLGIYVTGGRRSRAFVNIWAKTRNSQMIHAPQASWASQMQSKRLKLILYYYRL